MLPNIVPVASEDDFDTPVEARKACEGKGLDFFAVEKRTKPDGVKWGYLYRPGADDTDEEASADDPAPTQSDMLEEAEEAEETDGEEVEPVEEEEPQANDPM